MKKTVKGALAALLLTCATGPMVTAAEIPVVLDGENNLLIGYDQVDGWDIETMGYPISEGKANIFENNIIIGGNIVQYVTETEGTSTVYRSLNNAVLIGHSNEVKAANNAVSLGERNTISGTDAIAIGHKAISQADGNTIAIGQGAEARQNSAVAIAKSAKASGVFSVAIGDSAKASQWDAIALGDEATASGKKVTVLGSWAKASQSYATAIGSGANASAESAIAVGAAATASAARGVALGSGSATSTAGWVAGYDPSTGKVSADTSPAWKSGAGDVSVGHVVSGKGWTRQITGLAAGTADTDAVNVAQLKHARTEVKAAGSVSVSAETAGDGHIIYTLTGTDTNTTYELTGKKNDDNTTTITLEDNEGKSQSVTVATKDTRNTVSAGDHVKVGEKKNADGSSAYTVSVNTDGKIEKDNTDIITGGTVFSETRVENDGLYIKKDNTAGQNITALDHQVKQNNGDITTIKTDITKLNGDVTAAKTEVKAAGSVSVSSKTAADGHTIYTLTGTDTNTTYELTSKDNGDHTATLTLKGNDDSESTVTVATKDTTLQKGTSGLSVEGGKLHMTVADTAGNEVTGSVDLSAIASEVDTNTTYELSGKENDNNTTTITLKGNDDSESKVTVATRDTRNTVIAGDHIKLDEAKNELGGTAYTVHVKADGKVENGNTGIVSGDTVYKETHVKEDGSYVKKDYSAGENLTVLDKQVAGNTNSITNLQNNIHEVDRNLSKVGAGAAALAALHPLDFDPEDKWDVAAGFGNYRDASAVALGVFYRPNERTMLSLGTTLGDDRNLFNAGLSVKLGSGHASVTTSKARMAETIRRQDHEIRELKAKNAERDRRDAERDARMDALMKELEALKAGK